MLSEEDLSCSVCHEVFKEPVVLSCSHSFCKGCLKSWWREKPTQECPVCKRRSSRRDPPLNLALRNLCEAYVQQREQKTPEEQVCRVHSERLKLFCLTDQQPVCVVCRDSKVHEDHRFRPIVEAAQDLRDELDKSLLPLKKNLQKAKDFQKEFEEKADQIKSQFYQTKGQIQAEFKKLHQFLVEEEEFRMKALREEEERKTQRMKDKMAAVSREIEALLGSIRATEEQLRAPDVSFLLKYKAAVERVQRCPLLAEKPQLGPGALIDQAKHLGNLAFNVWTNMKRLVHPPVILNSIIVMNAVLSEDLTSFTVDDEDEVGVVFGSEWFDSGSHTWDVEVGDSEDWMLGVTNDPLEWAFKDANPEAWGIAFSDGEYKAAHNEEDTFLTLAPSPKKIRVHLKCDKHEVSFYDLDANTHIHTLTQITQKKLFPCFSTERKCPIKIVPQTV
uniref:Tripartite motif-containing protein 35-like n=1 Tax=Neogobius melanostomus TaxID=47308 RepID=A0A8C6SSP0_9GOBI